MLQKRFELILVQMSSVTLHVSSGIMIRSSASGRFDEHENGLVIGVMKQEV